MVFSNVEKVDIVSVFIKSHKNRRLARQEYMRLYPNRETPSAKTFANIYKIFRNSASLKRRPKKVQVNENEELDIILYFHGIYLKNDI